MSLQAPSASGSAIRSVGGAAVLVLLIVLAAVGGYALHEHSVALRLAAQNNDVTATLEATRGQIEALTTKLNAISAAQPAERAAVSPPVVYRRPLTAASRRHRIDDPRWKKIQGQLDEQGKQIESTRQDLVGARSELQGSIAKTHDELALLEKKGERNYYEFDLNKASQFQHDGPVGIRLRKANTKHEYADLELLVDDFNLSKKHVNIYEPVIFYAGDSKQPVELVINNISKNHIHGYVSAPKYKPGDLEAMSANLPADNAASTTNEQQNASPSSSPSSQRRQLEAPNPKATETKPN